MYPLLRKLFFALPPLKAHEISMSLMNIINSTPILNKLAKEYFKCEQENLIKQVFGLEFKNSIGLAAGFDKNAQFINELELLGFGFIEIGTVTPKAQPGNPQPTLFRLPIDKALINRMGFNNDGVEFARKRLEKYRTKQTNSKLIIGSNIGINKVTPHELAWKDYTTCFEALFDVTDYFVVNVSSPNTPGLRELQKKEMLDKILGELQHINTSKPKQKPILLKIAPDLNNNEVDDIINLTSSLKIDGLVVSNTSITRENLKTPLAEINAIGAGGLSGKPIQAKGNELLKYIHQCNPQMPIIASGGVFNGIDAKEKLELGASLVQVWTGFIYEGPSIVKNICKYLEKDLSN